MKKRVLNANNLKLDEDWHGNNAAFTCPACGKVFIVSNAPMMDSGKRKCPKCGKSTAYCSGGQKGEAWIEWEE